MNSLVLAAAFFTLVAAKEKPSPIAVDAAVAKEFGGKVWVQAESIRSASGPALRAWLAAHGPQGEVSRKTTEGPWTISFLAVFKKPALKGPMTVQYFEKGDPKELVDQYSPPNEEAGLVFIDTHDLEEDHGFNKGKTYIIKVGQIIKAKFVTYAVGQVSTR